MTKIEKENIARAARTLILLLNACDDPEYVDEVVSCVQDGVIYPSIDVEYMR